MQPHDADPALLATTTCRRARHVLFPLLFVAACSGSDEQGDSDTGPPDATGEADETGSDADALGTDADDVAADEGDVQDALPDGSDTDAADAEVGETDAFDAHAGDDGSVDGDAGDGDDAVDDAGEDAPGGDAVDAEVEDAPADAADGADDGVDDVTDAADTIDEPLRGTVAGRVVFEPSGEPAAGVSVTAGEASVLTDDDGAFVLPDVRGPEAVVRVGPADPTTPVSTTWQRVLVGDGATSHVSLAVARGCVATVDVETGPGRVLPSACGGSDRIAGITLPRGGVISAAGDVLARVTVVLVPLPIATSQVPAAPGLLAFPGGMDAIDASGGPAWLESLGAIEVRLYDAAGEAAALAEGETAELVFPADERWVEQADPSVPMWWFDEDAGVWIEEPALRSTIEVEPFSGTFVHRVSVPHFTWWNADRVAERTCIEGRVTGSLGGLAARPRVTTTGVDYLGSTSAQATADGAFRVLARAGSEVLVAAETSLGGEAFAVTRRVLTGGAGDVCTQLGDIELPTASIAAAAACVRGRVVVRGDDALGAAGSAVPRAQIYGTVSGRVVEATASDDGSFCLPVPDGQRFDLVATGDVLGRRYTGRLEGVRAARGTGLCGADGDDTCQSVGDVVVAAQGCVAGVVTNGAAAASGATVALASAHSVVSARTASDGTFCAAVDEAQLYRALAVVAATTRLSSAVWGEASVTALPTAGTSCAAPGTCARAEVFIDPRTCLSGRAVRDDGAPLAGARVLARPVDGGRATTSITGADGSYCVPAPLGVTVDIEVRAFDVPTSTRWTAATRGAGTTPGVCGVTSCQPVDTLFATGESTSGCIVGRLRDGGVPFDRKADLVYGAQQVAILPDRTGRFCADLPLLDVARVVDENGECLLPREFDLELSLLTAGSCGDPSGCLDVGEFDFEDFCVGS